MCSEWKQGTDWWDWHNYMCQFVDNTGKINKLSYVITRIIILEPKTWGGVTKLPLINFLIGEIFYYAKVLGRFFKSHSYLTGVCSDIWQIWMWYSISNARMHTQHWISWCPVAQAPQYPQCWLNGHCIGPVSYRYFSLIRNSFIQIFFIDKEQFHTDISHLWETLSKMKLHF